MTWAPVFLTLASYAAFLLLRHNAPLLHRLALSSMAVLDGMLSDVPEDDKLTALEQATSSLVLGLLKFLGLVVAGGTCIATPWPPSSSGHGCATHCFATRHDGASGAK